MLELGSDPGHVFLGCVVSGTQPHCMTAYIFLPKYAAHFIFFNYTTKCYILLTHFEHMESLVNILSQVSFRIK